MIGVGIHKGLSFAEYLALPYVNNSALQHARRSMAKVKAALDGLISIESPATKFGSLVHTLVLEPDDWKSRYVIDPGPGELFLDKKGNVAKSHRGTDAWSEWVKSQNGRVILTPEEKAKADDCAASVRRSPQAMALLAGKAQREVTIVWDDNGLMCKARIDILCDTIADLKTTGNVYEFEKSIGNFGYHRQAAFYRRGVRQVLGKELSVAFIAAESEAPYEVLAAPMWTDDIDEAERAIELDIAEVRRCQLSDTWPGAVSPDFWRVPEWAKTSEAA